MAISNFTELKTAVADWLNRDDLTAVIPDFITMAEADFNRKLRHWRQEKRVTTAADEQFENLPTDWVEMINLRISGSYQLELISRSEMADLRDANDNAGGKPLYYAYNAGQIEFYPSPDSSYTILMDYYAHLPALSDAVDANWLLTYYPDAYLYGTLLQAALYLRDNERYATWSAQYERIIEELTRTSKRAVSSGSSITWGAKRNG